MAIVSSSASCFGAGSVFSVFFCNGSMMMAAHAPYFVELDVGDERRAASSDYTPASPPHRAASPDYTPSTPLRRAASRDYTPSTPLCRSTSPDYTPSMTPCYAASLDYTPIDASTSRCFVGLHSVDSSSSIYFAGLHSVDSSYQVCGCATRTGEDDDTRLGDTTEEAKLVETSSSGDGVI
ncbi:hypothetical protein E2562_023181 [Oryza meyeriana var. granulata]|uniref:Uncharacterized protein n=1 Tax=Oryza meyeriana var. granulata TaxID=110450 RepID=A0A6G1BZI8_9ORYZ|nr:hypothetical protein E2562_023181 [Oryza meyeriana var. granulata]